MGLLHLANLPFDFAGSVQQYVLLAIKGFVLLAATAPFPGYLIYKRCGK
jgi:hypothetical protein